MIQKPPVQGSSRNCIRQPARTRGEVGRSSALGHKCPPAPQVTSALCQAMCKRITRCAPARYGRCNISWCRVQGSMKQAGANVLKSEQNLQLTGTHCVSLRCKTRYWCNVFDTVRSERKLVSVDGVRRLETSTAWD